MLYQYGDGFLVGLWWCVKMRRKNLKAFLVTKNIFKWRSF